MITILKLNLFFFFFLINVEPDQPDRAWLTDAPGLCHVPDFLHFLTNYAEHNQIILKIIRLG